MEYEFIEHLGGMDIRLLMVAIYKRHTHYHGDIELVLPVEGSVEISLAAQGERTLLGKGDIFVVNMNEAHSLVQTEENNAVLVLQFSPGFCRAYYPALTKLRVTGRHITQAGQPGLHADIHRHVADIVRCMGQKLEGYQLALTGTLNHLAFDMVNRMEHVERSKSELASEERNRVRLAGIVDYIQKNFMYRISLTEMAAREKLDMTYLSHLIKDSLGISFREYVNKLRLERAAELIANTDMRMIDVCVECGYSDYRYLNNAFLKEYGCTPAQMRELDIGGRPVFLRGQPSSGAEHSIMNIEEAYEKLMEYFAQNWAAPC